MENKTHWKKLHNPDYLGAYALDQGKDLIATIKSVQIEDVKNERGTEKCVVARFQERDIKPMILNTTNSKVIQKIYKTPYIEEWAGRKIQIYIDNIKAFGELVEALRIRPFVPRVQVEKLDTKCTDCKNQIKPLENVDAQGIAQHTFKKYGKVLCSDCATAESEKNKPKNLL